MDGLSELPDSMLLYMMSFMDMRSVVRTSELSKRWRNLWKSVLDMDFPLLQGNSFFVDRSIALHTGSKIRKFRVCAEHDLCPLERVDFWIYFAVSRNVEELCLDFFPTDGDELDMNTDRYETPQCIFTCPSLVSLTLRRCNINLPASIRLPVLSSLTLKRTDFADDLLKDLISGCPLLEDLTLYDCNRCYDLNIFADENSRLKSLKVIEWDYLVSDEAKLQIFAPNLLSLDFVDYMPRKSYEVKNLRSLTVASFNIAPVLENQEYSTTSFVEMLDQIRHVKVLKLCTGCIVFEDYFQDEYDVDENEYWKSVETSFLIMLQHLKCVQIRGVDVGTVFVADPVVVEDVEKENILIKTKEVMVEDILKGKGEGKVIEFMKILLKNSAVVETLSITTQHGGYYADCVFIC